MDRIREKGLGARVCGRAFAGEHRFISQLSLKQVRPLVCLAFFSS